jgi:hypothetical protein
MNWNSIAYHTCFYSTVNKHGTNNCVVNQSRVSGRGVNPCTQYRHGRRQSPAASKRRADARSAGRYGAPYSK